MPQDHNTGRTGNDYGRMMALRVAAHIDATLTRRGSNEVTLFEFEAYPHAIEEY